MDLLSIEPIRANVVTVQADMTDPKTWSLVRKQLESVGSKAINQDRDSSADEARVHNSQIIPDRFVDVVLSDMAHSFTGNKFHDQTKVLDLAETAYTVATQILKPRGHFVVKVLMSQDVVEFRSKLRKMFQIVKTSKPAASRSGSMEIYLVCLEFKPDGEMLDVE